MVSLNSWKAGFQAKVKALCKASASATTTLFREWNVTRFSGPIDTMNSPRRACLLMFWTISITQRSIFFEGGIANPQEAMIVSAQEINMSACRSSNTPEYRKTTTSWPCGDNE
jgi:hypothetical protein